MTAEYNSLTDYCRSVTIVTKNQNDLFHSENWPITPENWPISALFGVKNVVNFSNSSRQYLVNDKSVFTKLIDTRVFSTIDVCLQMCNWLVKLCGKRRVGGPFRTKWSKWP